MTFSEKLDLLMTLTGTSNSALGRALSYDPSYISRVRAGKRGLPRRQPFLKPAADYFAQAIDTPVQQSTAANLLIAGRPWPKDPAQGAVHILRWLEASPEDMNEPIGQFFQNLTAAPLGAAERLPVEVPPRPEGDPAFFFGNQGKREAVHLFLAELCAAEEGGVLHLVSDETMDWLFDDPVFARQWADLLTRFLARGGQVTIIHTIDRDLGEMLGALQRWIPLYLTGRILPYYCPRLRDGICRRSLFVAPGRAALAANSIEDRTEGMANLYTRHPQAVAALEQEFTNYLALCRPLMDVYHAGQSRELSGRLVDMIRGEGLLISASPVPLPLASRLPALQFLRQALLDRVAAGGELTELIHLPDPRAVADRSVFIPLGDLLGLPDYYYTPQLLREQVIGASVRGKTAPGYQVIFSQRLPGGVTLLARNRQEVLVFASAPPCTAFALTEPRMTSALWDYLTRAAGSMDQKASPRRLTAWLREMDRLEPGTAGQGKG